MTIIEVAHVVRAAADVTKEDEFVIIGSQSILGAYPNIDDEVLTRSAELDLYPRHRPDLADEITGALGELSPFHETHGYYADGVGPETAALPPGWEDRLILETDMQSLKTADGRQAKAYFLEPHDLLCAKYAAGREKDYDFCDAAIAQGLVKKTVLLERLAKTPMHEKKRNRAEAFVESAFKKRDQHRDFSR